MGMTNLEASLEGCKEREMALPSEIPLAAHLLTKQKEHALFLPQCGHCNQQHFSLG